VAERRPDRVRGAEHDRFWSYCSSDELRLQRCATCRHLNWPPVSESCERCDARDLSWEALSGRAVLVSWCTFHQRYYDDDGDVPYDAIVVELEEGALFISNPLGFSMDMSAVDMPVSLAFIDAFDTAGPFRLPVFRQTV